MRRAERRRADRQKSTPRALREIDYLLRVSDEARHGALRFAEEESVFLAPSRQVPIPPLVELPGLLTASERVNEDTDTEEDLRLLLAPGSSLGGVRPKASVRDLPCKTRTVIFASRNSPTGATSQTGVTSMTP